jgi:ABC-type Fe3+/spermidine/putrescine transport system ATPase subunit
LADRLVVMHAGRIEQVGTPAAVWQQPANAFVARFLGWNVTRAFTDAPAAVRPEAVRVVESGEQPEAVDGEVTARTFHRDHFLLAVRLDALGGEADPVQVEVPVDAAWVPDVGDRVALAVDARDIVRFD